MKPKATYSLQRTMMVYFLLIGFAALLVGLEFIAEIHGGDLRQVSLSGFLDPGSSSTDERVLGESLAHIRNKAILVIAIIMVVILIVMTMFMKHITEPLQHMIAAARKISGGDLSQTVRIESNNELAELGAVINEMASNLQEIIQLTRHAGSSSEKFLASLSAVLAEVGPEAGGQPDLQVEMDRFRTELTMLQSTLDCFKVYAIPESRT